MLSEITKVVSLVRGQKRVAKKLTQVIIKVISKLANHRGAAGYFKGNIVVKGKLHAQKANDQETVMEEHYSVSVLRQFHKEVTEF